MNHILFFLFFATSFPFFSQTNMYRDTIPVYESGSRLLNPWAGGINFSSFSQMDVNFDGKQDLVLFDKVGGSGGKLKIFLNDGTTGQTVYKHGPEYQDKFPALAEWALFYDYNNDGKSDIFCYTLGGIKVFKNTSTSGQLSFSLQKSLLVSDYNPHGSPNMNNIPANPVGLPAIADIDGDGDLDILTYSTFGIKMEYHKNMSMELYSHADSLVYDMVDNCWGDIAENNCIVDLYQCPLFKLYGDVINEDASKVLHAGACIMCFDRDGDGDQDVILGDVSCSTVHYVENGGSATNAHIVDTTVLYPNYPDKASTTVIKMNTFPCTYNLDINNDGIKDLIASPNAISGSENYQSVWYYLNTSTTPTVSFVLQQKNFLQDGMIELGENAYPVLFDADADGKKDLIVGNLGYYMVNTNKSRLAYYRNIGTATAPSFSLITRDYQNLSSYNLYSMAPTFGDLDGDGDQDMIIGATNGRVHYFENTAGAGNAAVFGNYTANYQNILASNFAYPQLFDVDKNGTLDLLIGSTNGRLTYYKNTGTSSVPNFSFTAANFGGVDVRPVNFTTGYSVPFMYRDAGVTKLLVGSESGAIFMYDNIDGNLTGTFNKADTNLYKINEGARCAVWFEDITADGLRDLFVGNQAGGLAFFNSSNVNGVGVREYTDASFVKLFPNPASDCVYIDIDDGKMQEVQITITNVAGQIVHEQKTFNKQIRINTTAFGRGVYFVSLTNRQNGMQVVKKLILN